MRLRRRGIWSLQQGVDDAELIVRIENFSPYIYLGVSGAVVAERPIRSTEAHIADLRRFVDELRELADEVEESVEEVVAHMTETEVTA